MTQKSTYNLIKEGWFNDLNYHSLSEETKKLIQQRAKKCMGEKEDMSEKCENLTYSPVYRIIEKLVEVFKEVPVFNMKSRKLEMIETGQKTIEPKKITTGDITGAKGFKCSACGCSFNAMISSPDKHCVMNKW